MAASDDTWRIEIKCAFPGPTAVLVSDIFSYFKLAGLKYYTESISLLSPGQLAPQVLVISCILFVIVGGADKILID